jgi:hypothetical protein
MIGKMMITRITRSLLPLGLTLFSGAAWAAQSQTLNLDIPQTKATYTDQNGNTDTLSIPNGITIGTLTTTGQQLQTLNLVIPQTNTTYTDQNGNTDTLSIPSGITIGTLTITPAPSPPPTTVSVINRNDGVAGVVTSVMTTLPSVTAGQPLFVSVGWCSTTNVCSAATGSNKVTFSDSNGDTFTTGHIASGTGSYSVSGAYILNPTASAGTETFTAKFAAAVGYPYLEVVQLNIPSSFGALTLDTSNGAQCSGGNLSIPLKTTQTNELIYTFAMGSGSSFTPGPAQTQIYFDANAAFDDTFQVAAASGSNPQTFSGAGVCSGFAYAFK